MSPLAPELDTLLGSRREGHGLPRAFYHNDALYALEMQKIWYEGWLFAGFAFEMPKPGDFLTFTVDSTPVLVIRDDQGEVRAFHNVCRHRGTQLCRTDTGHVRAIVCPYHSWTYSRQGDLIACQGMHDGVDKSALSLRRLHAEVCAGLIYVSLAEAPPDFGPLRARFEAAARPQGFDRAKIATITDYDVESNWKLVWENNRECFHCVGRHPQYVKANFDVYEEAYASEAIRQKMAAAVERTQSKWASQGIAITHTHGGLAPFPDPDHDLWFAADRTVLAEGFDTESMDGRRVAPLMGDYRDADVGVLRMRSMPNFWVHASCDHAVAARLLPTGPRTTRLRAYWLVRDDAREGEDYRLDQLLPFWQLTNEQDWEICKWQQKGVDSIGYQPGPLSQRKEYNVDAFIRWYLKQMQSGGRDAAARPLTRVA
ncbi:MAG TPA: aromatic ring-hydroxylating dioxygenase subunit alpha [Casimicrobiaceae bacterium]|nr:aromatic ring-hydroxylating dioxygenase subunit alpha [Casimicrobiaceae bacterium]